MTNMALEQVLEMAIEREARAHEFYLKLADRVEDPSTSEALRFLAKEEEHHKDILNQYRRGDLPGGALSMGHGIPGHLAEHLGHPGWRPGWRPEDAFLAAAEEERRAHDFYRALASEHPQGEVRKLLEKLAASELAHKSKVEYLYVNTAFPQTDGG